MTAPAATGRKIPQVRFGLLVDGEVESIAAQQVFAGHRTVVIGVPGAFTPVCTQLHVPDFVRSADRLRAAGYTQLVCIVANDPFVVDAWATMLDPERKIRFLSDGNLAFTRAIGAASHERELFLGERSHRYMMQVEFGIVTNFKIEPTILTFSCTSAADAIDSAATVELNC